MEKQRLSPLLRRWGIDCGVVRVIMAEERRFSRAEHLYRLVHHGHVQPVVSCKFEGLCKESLGALDGDRISRGAHGILVSSVSADNVQPIAPLTMTIIKGHDLRTGRHPPQDVGDVCQDGEGDGHCIVFKDHGPTTICSVTAVVFRRHHLPYSVMAKGACQRAVGGSACKIVTTMRGAIANIKMKPLLPRGSRRRELLLRHQIRLRPKAMVVETLEHFLVGHAHLFKCCE
mmetsp:Transcript_50443/g.141161  ORF Transcript_50443/g.141161 Transcript_50443/m.141161 type:complete len:230 (-) Transcript_50443:345-1034(-)